MAFRTPEERNYFFKKAASFPDEISYGTALSHARGTNLGIWGDKQALYRDCAIIMAIELQRYQIERREEPTISAEDVSGSSTFREAYNAAREPKGAALHNLVRALGSNADRLEHRTVHSGPQRFEGLYDAVLREIQHSPRKNGY